MMRIKFKTSRFFWPVFRKSKQFLKCKIIRKTSLHLIIINHGEMFNEFLSVASLSDAETNALVEKWTNDPSVIDSLSQFAVIFLLLAAVSVFQLVVTVLPSKKPKQPVVATIDY
ncbi:MAG: hypothetical protein RL545_551 [Actinomycetota bacterium]